MITGKNSHSKNYTMYLFIPSTNNCWVPTTDQALCPTADMTMDKMILPFETHSLVKEPDKLYQGCTKIGRHRAL
jgi:hypothetical protein